MEYVIVGVDPGKTAAIACVDLEGRVAKIAYSRFPEIGWFISQISSAGTPILIASDKRKIAHLLEKLSAIFNIRYYTPDVDMSVERKKELVRKYNVQNNHERDALAAALTAYNTYANKLRQAESIAKSKGYENVSKVKAMVIKEYSIYDAITERKTKKRAR